MRLKTYLLVAMVLVLAMGIGCSGQSSSSGGGVTSTAYLRSLSVHGTCLVPPKVNGLNKLLLMPMEPGQIQGEHCQAETLPGLNREAR